MKLRESMMFALEANIDFMFMIMSIKHSSNKTLFDGINSNHEQSTLFFFNSVKSRILPIGKSIRTFIADENEI